MNRYGSFAGPEVLLSYEDVNMKMYDVELEYLIRDNGYDDGEESYENLEITVALEEETVKNLKTGSYPTFDVPEVENSKQVTIVEIKEKVMTKEELVEEAKKLGRYENKLVDNGDKRYLLSKTVQSFDDEVENSLIELASKLAVKFNLINSTTKKDYSMDLASDVRDEMIKFVLKRYGIDEELFGYEEF